MFMPAPAQGRINYTLRNPELYNLVDDPKESYDCAAKYPDVVATIQKSIQEQLATLPDVVKQAYTTTQQHLSTPEHAGGQPAGVSQLRSKPRGVARRRGRRKSAAALQIDSLRRFRQRWRGRLVE